MLISFIMVPLVIPEIILGISLLMTFSVGGIKVVADYSWNWSLDALYTIFNARANFAHGRL